MPVAKPRSVRLCGTSLTLSELARIARDPRTRIEIDDGALARVARGEQQVVDIVKRYEQEYAACEAARSSGSAVTPPTLDYGVTTGFGEFKRIAIDPDKLIDLQSNILLSHATGVGNDGDYYDPAGYYPAEVVRAVLAIRLNAFLRGHSGVRVALVETLKRMLERGVVPLVPLRGSVGSSGDLCPLAHLFVVLVGEGAYYRVRDADAMNVSREQLRSLLGERSLDPAARATRRGELARILLGDNAAPVEINATANALVPRHKEGLALTNGASFAAALLALASHRATNLVKAADIAAGLSMEAACACGRALDPKVQQARGMVGQIHSAASLRALLSGSRLIDRQVQAQIQDAYSLRCAAAVHGASRDAIAYATMVATAEINAATDNPLFFPDATDDAPWDVAEFATNAEPGYDGNRRSSYSAGNFHGQPVGLAADFLTIAVAELGNIAERRTQLLLDAHHSRGLPANLALHAGVNTGYMIAQYAAASVVSENKILAHPASVDSIPTSSNIEDHVAMATTAARKLLIVVANVQAVLAIELMVAARAVELRVLRESLGELAPDRRDAILNEVIRGGPMPEDLAPQLRALVERQPPVAPWLGTGTAVAHAAIRRAIEPVTEDRPLDRDIATLRRLLESNALVEAVEAAVTIEPVAKLGFRPEREAQ